MADQDLFSIENCNGAFDSDDEDLDPRDCAITNLPVDVDDEGSDMEVDSPPKLYADLRREWEQLEESQAMEFEEVETIQQQFELPNYVDSEEEQQIVQEEQLFEIQEPARKRGRPSKAKATSSAKPRGRPPKNLTHQPAEKQPRKKPSLYTWITTPPEANECRRTTANIIRQSAGVHPNYKFISVVEGFKRFITPQMIDMVVNFSNIFIDMKKLKLNPVTSNDIYAYIGVRMMIGAYNDSSQDILGLWSRGQG